MQVKDILNEYRIELDDIRWYLSDKTAIELLAYRERQTELVKFIWSKALEDSLYNMEERFLADLEEQFEKRQIDEVFLRNLCLECLSLRRKRH